MTPEEQNKALDAWQTSARYWDKYRVLIEQMFAPLPSGLVEEARSGVGQEVLDIGGGSGEPSLTISCIVGPTGSVMYTDPVAGMVETAQAEAGRRGLTNIHFRQCSADDLPFADRTFDVAVSRLSAMFFVDPVAAVREALRVIREDGYVSFVVWGPKEANPFFSTVADGDSALAAQGHEGVTGLPPTHLPSQAAPFNPGLSKLTQNRFYQVRDSNSRHPPGTRTRRVCPFNRDFLSP